MLKVKVKVEVESESKKEKEKEVNRLLRPSQAAGDSSYRQPFLRLRKDIEIANNGTISVQSNHSIFAVSHLPFFFPSLI